MIADSILIVLCLVAAKALRLDSTEFLSNSTFWVVLLWLVPVTIVVFYQLGLYRSVVRFITGQALKAIAAGVFFSAVVLFLTIQLTPVSIPRSAPGIYAVLLFLAVGGIRFLLRGILLKPSMSGREPVAIYGAGEAGRQLHNALVNGREYTPVAFIDDDPALLHSLIAGKRIIAPQHISRLVKDAALKSILLAIPSTSRARRREIVASLEPLGVEIKTMPGMADIISGRAKFSDLHFVTPEDLLGRDPVNPHQDLMRRNIADKVVMVTGAGGSIGSELCRQIIDCNPAALILFEASELALYTISLDLRDTLAREGRSVRIEPVLGSVQNRNCVRNTLRAFDVQTIYHAAAYKHVGLVEDNVVEGIRNNVFGTHVIAEAAAELKVESFILISTDKAVRPTNFMGASKRMAELVCQALSQDDSRTTFCMVRFGNVLGSSGSVIPRFRAQIEQGGPVTVTSREITRFFMTIPEASQLVIQAGALARGGDVFVLDMGDPVKILELAKSMIRLHGLKPYMMEDTHPPDSAPGDIAIQIVGLTKGEKLYEELLIGENPTLTEHPRIMTANEQSLSMITLNTFLNRLSDACDAFDNAAIREILLDAPLGFRPDVQDSNDFNATAKKTQYAQIAL